MKKIELSIKPCNWKNDPIISNLLLSIGAVIIMNVIIC
jgi:hypothetical protein